MAQSWSALRAKIASRYRERGSWEATRHYFGRAKHLAHQLVYDRWLDRLERKSSGRSSIVRPDQIAGPVPPPEERLYQAFPRLPFLWSIKALGIKPTAYSFVDFGSGRGRLLLAAAHLPFQRVIGVEFAFDVHLDACENIEHYPQERLKCHDVVSLPFNAADFDMPKGNFVAFFFNPFTGDILDRVAQRIEDACEMSARSVRVIFVNSNRVPLFAHRPAFRPFRPSLMNRIWLAAMSPAPVEFFCVGE